MEKEEKTSPKTGNARGYKSEDMSCDLCRRNAGEHQSRIGCGDTSLDGRLVCTRRKEHRGQHAACGLSCKEAHPLARW